MASQNPKTEPNPRLWLELYAAFVGLLLGLSLLKFGNPVILDHLIEPPSSYLEVLYQTWPVSWGYYLLTVVVVIGLKAARRHYQSPRWLIALPLIWLGWQFISATQTVHPGLTAATLKHFSACVVFYYLGLLTLGRVQNPTPIAFGILIGFLPVLWIAFNQHYGGLDETRRFVFEHTDWKLLPPQYLKKLESDRVFSTLVYPNALAGVIILLLPMMMVLVWNLTSRMGRMARLVLVGLLGYAGVASLIWSGSKAGWLIGLTMVLVALVHAPLPRMAKASFVAGLLTIGIIAFFVRYQQYFERGATSLNARFDYWSSAVQTTLANPVFGTGPGTFSVPYKKSKSPDSEMAQLAHNDYLEQASDSGFIGFFSYFLFISASLTFLYRNSSVRGDSLKRVLWLGIFGWAMQGFVEFNLYVPALAWNAFFLIGWLLGSLRLHGNERG